MLVFVICSFFFRLGGGICEFFYFGGISLGVGSLELFFFGRWFLDIFWRRGIFFDFWEGWCLGI